MDYDHCFSSEWRKLHAFGFGLEVGPGFAVDGDAGDGLLLEPALLNMPGFGAVAWFAHIGGFFASVFVICLSSRRCIPTASTIFEE